VYILENKENESRLNFYGDEMKQRNSHSNRLSTIWQIVHLSMV